MPFPIMLSQILEYGEKATEELGADPPDYPTLIIYAAVVAMLIAIGYWGIRKIRGDGTKKDKAGHAVFSTFRELHEQGELSDEEYKKIKGSVIRQLKDEELKDDDGAV